VRRRRDNGRERLSHPPVSQSGNPTAGPMSMAAPSTSASVCWRRSLPKSAPRSDLISCSAFASPRRTSTTCRSISGGRRSGLRGTTFVGNDLPETTYYARKLEALGVDYLHIDCGFGFPNPKGSPGKYPRRGVQSLRQRNALSPAAKPSSGQYYLILCPRESAICWPGSAGSSNRRQMRIMARRHSPCC